MNESRNSTLYASLLTDNALDAALLDAWFDERAVSAETATEDLPDEIASVRQDNGRLAKAVTADAYDGNIAPGQIRILSKRFTADPDIVPYVVVLEPWYEGMWLVAPFSQYSYPATPGEMTTGIRHVGLRVLQAWNVRTIQDGLLAKSFLFGELSDGVRQECLALFRHEMGGRALPESFKSLRGGAILMESDPRRDYIAETIARLRPLSTAVKATERIQAELERRLGESGQSSRRPPSRPPRKRPTRTGSRKSDWIPRMEDLFAEKVGRTRIIEEQYRLAAGTRKPCTESYDVGGVTLDLEFSPEADKVVFTFYDAEDEKYLGYDGYGLFGAEGEFLGTFQEGVIQVPAESIRDPFMIVDIAGEVVSVSPKN